MHLQDDYEEHAKLKHCYTKVPPLYLREEPVAFLGIEGYIVANLYNWKIFLKTQYKTDFELMTMFYKILRDSTYQPECILNLLKVKPLLITMQEHYSNLYPFAIAAARVQNNIYYDSSKTMYLTYQLLKFNPLSMILLCIELYCDVKKDEKQPDSQKVDKPTGSLCITKRRRR